MHENQPDHSAVLKSIIDDSIRILKADRGALLIFDEENDTIRFEASIGLSAGYLAAIAQFWKEVSAGRLLNNPELIFVREARTDPRLAAIHPAIESEGYTSLVSVPLRSGEAIQGWLALYFDRIRDLSPIEKSTIQIFGDHVANAIDNKRLFDQEREASRRLEKLQDLTWISHPPLGGWIFECDLEYFFLSGALAVEPRPVDGWS